MLYVSALGQGEVHLNGSKVGDAELAPSWTDYRKTVRYEAYDVTAMLRAGENAVGVMVGNGMFNVVKTPHRYTKLVNSFGRPMVMATDAVDVCGWQDRRWLPATDRGRRRQGRSPFLQPTAARTTTLRRSRQDGTRRAFSDGMDSR